MSKPEKRSGPVRKHRKTDHFNKNVSYDAIRTPQGYARLLTDSLPCVHPEETGTIAPYELAVCDCKLGGLHATAEVMEYRAQFKGAPRLCVNCKADAEYEREQRLAEMLGLADGDGGWMGYGNTGMESRAGRMTHADMLGVSPIGSWTGDKGKRVGQSRLVQKTR